MNIEDFLKEQSEEYLIECYYELENWRKTGVLQDGKIREIHNQFNSSPTQLYMIGELIYRQIAMLYIQQKY